MRVLVIGGGGREHALADTLRRSLRVHQVFCAPGNAGTARIASNLAIRTEDHRGLLQAAQELGIHLTVVGPEAPLCSGIVDRFRTAGLRIFGPTAAAARIEGDKGYAKRLMKNARVPTAEGRMFENHAEARDYVASRETGVVVKAAGLAGGKGVFVCEDSADGLTALDKIMVENQFGDAGDTVVVEELLRGEELSVFALVSGHTIYVLDSAQDYKRIGDHGTGANTGGMGAVSPGPLATSEIMSIVERDILVPIVDALESDGAAYTGLLYAGLMITPGGPKVLEFNCRFGDPETQVLLIRLESDLAELLLAATDGTLEQADVRWSPKPAVSVVMASQGYPDAYETGHVIEGLDHAADSEDVRVFHCGTAHVEHLLVTSGGRVLAVSARGDDLENARAKAYEAVRRIHFQNQYYRTDVGLFSKQQRFRRDGGAAAVEQSRTHRTGQLSLDL